MKKSSIHGEYVSILPNKGTVSIHCLEVVKQYNRLATAVLGVR